ncbi:MAG TPA: RidA family protein [Burkholderiales bacterium]|jgi:enamine deaminase RidA (YjgF/YER057c/UK114 family)|nr:RidA family protein [Burkholderiales bacterium]
MLKVHNPKSVAAPIGTYSHGIEAPPNARWLHVAGQIGVRPDGSVPATIEEQTEVVWQNILSVLADAGMGIGDVVKITSFLTRFENFPKFAQVRAQYLGSHRPASTLLVISSLARPEFLVEVEAIAAKASAPIRPARRPSARRTSKAKRRARR